MQTGPTGSPASGYAGDTATSGLYIVTLGNETPVSVNRGDARIEHRCIAVTREHCKFGKAKHFDVRRAGYVRVFGAQHVTFTPLFALDEIVAAERAGLRNLLVWRMRGRSGRRNEWLHGIAPVDVERIARTTLLEAGFPFRQIGSIGRLQRGDVPAPTGAIA